MSRVTAWLLAPLVMIAWIGSAAPARSDDATCDDLKDECIITSIDPGNPAVHKPGDPASKPKTERAVPQCSAFAGGVVAPVGASLADLGLGDAAHRGWRRVECVEGLDPAWIWIDPGVNAESIARMLLARLQLQPPRIGWTPTRVGGMGYVGVPTWLWVDDPGRLTWGPATISAGGVTLTARAESVTWSMGNGDEVRCANRGTPWRQGMGAGPSPTCGYLYERQGRYQVTATVHWVARWSGYGRSGAIPLSLSQGRTLEVGEVQVIVTR